jgi:AbrB family looped-hinge helix DNA binding protein
METVVSSKGQVVLPAELRREDHIESGQRFLVERLEAGVYVLKKVAPSPNSGFVNWLRACPEDGWFQNLPLDSTDSL